MIDELIEVEIKDNFLVIKETLSRIGVASDTGKTLYQSCHILHKQGRYYIVHFKELFILDGKQSTLDEVDISRRNTIVGLLEQWKLLTVKKPEVIKNPVCPMSKIKVVSSKEKQDWNFQTKYTVGRRKGKA